MPGTLSPPVVHADPPEHQRTDRPMKPRHHLYLDDELTNELEALASKPGASKSSIVADALRSYFRHRAGNAEAKALSQRLDRIAQKQDSHARDIEVVLEAIAQFVNIYFALTGSVPNPDEASQKRGRHRFDFYIKHVGKILAAGSTFGWQVEEIVEAHQSDNATSDGEDR
jgi:predicted transcriptional regulator